MSEPYEHMISYDNGNKSFFVYQNKDNIKVKRINYSENEEAKDITTYDITFKETNQKIIVDYLEERFKDSKENYFFLDSIDISGKAQFILNSLSYNDESYLEKADKFMFEISNTNVKCPTVYLYIYNDKTYEFYHTFQDGKPVDKKVGTYTKDATSMIVAQRIGTIINADKIMVLDKGECVGMGTHKELLKNCEVYKEIALSQLSEEELNNA